MPQDEASEEAAVVVDDATPESESNAIDAERKAFDAAVSDDEPVVDPVVEESESVETTEEVATEETESKVSELDQSAAASALLRDGWGIAKINKMMAEDPEGMVQIGLARAKSYQASIFSEIPKESTQTVEPTQGSSDPVTFAQVIEPLKSLDGDVPGLSEKLGESFNTLVAGLAQDFTAKLDAQSRLIEELRTGVTDRDVSSMRAEFTKGDWPMMDQDAVFNDVKAKFDQFQKSGVYSDTRAAFKDAVTTVLGDQRIELNKQSVQAERTKRKAGQPTVKSAKPSDTAGSLNPDQSLLDAFTKTVKDVA